jgi:hypothetical protein
VAHRDDVVTLAFRERLTGPVGCGTASPHEGAVRGRGDGSRLVLDLVVTIDDLVACVTAPDRPVRVAGRARGAVVGAAAVEGAVRLSVADPEVGMKRSEYRLELRAADGRAYVLEATRFVRPRRATWHALATVYARLTAADEAPGRALAAGVLAARLWDVPALLWSVRVTGGSYVAGLTRLLASARRELRTPVAPQAT